jgi:hypothetical protein
MQTAHGKLHLEIQTTRKSPVGILRTSFRENGKMMHTQHGRITGCSLQQLGSVLDLDTLYSTLHLPSYF